MKTQKHSKEIDDFSGLPSWVETFNFYHHSPSGCQRPDGMEFLEKVEARPRKIFSPANAPMISGTQGESHCKRVVIDGDDPNESYRHAVSVLEEHKPAPWDEADKAKHEIILNGEYESVPLEKTGTVFELTLEHLVLGLREATKGENLVEDGPWISLPMDGLILPFAGEIDVKTRGMSLRLKRNGPSSKPAQRGVGHLTVYQQGRSLSTLHRLLSITLGCPGRLTTYLCRSCTPTAKTSVSSALLIVRNCNQLDLMTLWNGCA